MDVDAWLATDATNTVADSSTAPAVEGMASSTPPPTAPHVEGGDDWAVKQRPFTPANVAEVKQALAFLDPQKQNGGDHDRAVWLGCLMALLTSQ